MATMPGMNFITMTETANFNDYEISAPGLSGKKIFELSRRLIFSLSRKRRVQLKFYSRCYRIHGSICILIIRERME